LSAPAGLLVDRERTVSFSFENRRFEGYAGDCIASALAANDQWLLTRSFKYHRPRGVLSMAGQDANTLVQLPGSPNALADREPVVEDLRVCGQNYTGSLDDDREAWIGRFAKFLPVGFYYKAFYKPRGVWEKWAPLIRRKAGLGVVDTRVQPRYFDKQYLFCDVAVAGAGPAGMEAALTAAEAGAEVILVDENPILGGSLCYARFDADGCQAEAVRAELVAAVEAHANIRVFTDATLNGWFSDNWLPIIKGNRLYKTRASECILAVGSLEQPAIFHNNDLPGVMLGSAAQRLIKLYGVRPGKRAVVLTGNDDGYAVALDLLDAGVEIAALVEMREAVPADAMARAVAERGVTVFHGYTIYAALGTSGNRHVRGVDVRRIEMQGQCASAGSVIDCDLLCMSAGYVPTYQLACQAGARLDYDDESARFALRDLPASLHVAGSVRGQHALDNVRADGRSAGAVAAGAAGLPAGPVNRPPDDTTPVNFPWPIFPHPKGKEFVDLDEDLQVADIVNATRDGYEHVQLVKRYSTVGMGPSQGRQSALATARLVADATGRSVAETGVTTARPPFAPELIAHNAGRSFYPERHTPMHHRHLEAGAQMLMAGAWMRQVHAGRSDACAQSCRPGGCIHAGWPRRARSRCRRVSQPYVHLRVCETARRAIALRADDQ
jgi:sarcosine oxidase subunit alpha